MCGRMYQSAKASPPKIMEKNSAGSSVDCQHSILRFVQDHSSPYRIRCWVLHSLCQICHIVCVGSHRSVPDTLLQSMKVYISAGDFAIVKSNDAIKIRAGEVFRSPYEREKPNVRGHAIPEAQGRPIMDASYRLKFLMGCFVARVLV